MFSAERPTLLGVAAGVSRAFLSSLLESFTQVPVLDREEADRLAEEALSRLERKRGLLERFGWVVVELEGHSRIKRPIVVVFFKSGDEAEKADLLRLVGFYRLWEQTAGVLSRKLGNAGRALVECRRKGSFLPLVEWAAEEGKLEEVREVMESLL